MTVTLALPEPASITPAQIPGICMAVEAEALATDDVQVITEMHARWSAVTEYLALKSRDGIAQAEATKLRLLARIGELSPAGPTGRAAAKSTRFDPDAGNETPPLSPNRLTEARHLAANPDLVADVIAESTDAAPPTKAEVMRRIRDHTPRPAARELTEAELIAQEVEQANERARRRLRGLVDGWLEIPGLDTHDSRDDILAGLIDHDRAQVLAIEAVYLYWKAAHA